jgi:hypothetical protein
LVMRFFLFLGEILPIRVSSVARLPLLWLVSNR